MPESNTSDPTSRGPSRAGEVLARIPPTVAEVMTRAVTTLSPDDALVEAVQLFGEGGFRHLLVVDADRRLTGVLSDRDALRAMARGQAADETQVAAAMARDHVVARPTMSLMDAIDMMVFHGIHCLPVVDERGTLCGVVTRTDLLAAFHAFLDRVSLLPPV